MIGIFLKESLEFDLNLSKIHNQNNQVSKEQSQKEKEINSLLFQQKNAYEEIWSINKKIASLNPTKDTAEIDALNAKKRLQENIFVSTQKSLDKYGSLVSAEKSLGDLAKIRDKAETDIAVTVGKQQDALANQANKIQLLIDNGTYDATYDNLIAKTQQWSHQEEKLTSSVKELKAAYEGLKSNSTDEEKIAAAKRWEQAVKSVNNAVKQTKLEYATDSQISSFHQKLQEFYDKNSATHKDWGDDLKKMLTATSNGAKVTNTDLETMKSELDNINNSARQAGKLGDSFFSGLISQAKKFTQWVNVTGLIMNGWQIGKDMVRNVIELDDSLLELVKVSDFSEQSLVKVTKQAYELGETVGRTGKQVIDSVTEFKRAGYELDDSMDMAKAALVMTNVAEGIDETSDAAGTLISVLKGYNMAENEAMSVVDKMNQASNLNPIGFDQIAEGLERTAGTMAQSRTTIDQTIGLITAGYAQLRNVEKVSTGLITLSARLRGVGEDGEVIDGLTAKLQEDFGKIGVAIEGADGNLRSIYEIAQDYSKVLPTLSDKQKQYYAELAAGKRQVTVWNAITQQFKDAEKASEDSINSLNSASVENQKYLESISGKVSQFESAFEQLSSTIVDSNLVKFFVDLGTNGVSSLDTIINKFGTLSTLTTLGSGALGATGHGLTNYILQTS